LSFSKFLQDVQPNHSAAGTKLIFFISTCFQILHSLHSPAAFALCAPLHSAALAAWISSTAPIAVRPTGRRQFCRVLGGASLADAVGLPSEPASSWARPRRHFHACQL
jgi:hypothetical protein